LKYIGVLNTAGTVCECTAIFAGSDNDDGGAAALGSSLQAMDAEQRPGGNQHLIRVIVFKMPIGTEPATP
jgi:hypothetical protein